MSSPAKSFLKGSLTYLLFVQLVLQIDSYFALKIRQESGVDISDAVFDVAGIFQVEKPLIALIIAAFTAIICRSAIADEFRSSSLAKSVARTTSTKKELKSGKLTNTVKENALDVVVVGCGMPKKGMGWYHLTQLLDMPNANMIAVVEPFFMSEKLCPTPPEAFTEMVNELKAAGVTCTDSVSKLPKFAKHTMCLIAGRTVDNPRLFKQCIEQGAKTIYLEKPGAPSVAELQEMRDFAKSKGVKVYLGYNKNVTPYVQKALSLSKNNENSTITFCHNNSYKKNELNECFTRNSEGMLKNMAIHELALLVSFFDVTVDTIKEFKVNTNPLFTEKLSVWVPGTVVPNAQYISDFSRMGFTVISKSGNTVSVMADRCGGNVSFAKVMDAKGQQIEKFEFPDAETQIKVEKQCAEDPEMMPYFFVQSDDYFTLKDRVINSSLKNIVAEGIATIDVGIEALKLAEHFTEETNKVIDAM